MTSSAWWWVVVGIASPALAADDEVPAEPDAPVEEAPESEAPPPPPVIREAPKPTAAPVFEEEALPIPTLTIDRIPPSTSYEFALQVSYGQVPYFREDVPSWVGFGFRGGWGKNFGLHRVGVSGSFSAEGAMGVQTVLALEPHLTYDLITPQGLLLGAGVGPALMHWVDASRVTVERDWGVAPSAAARVGWSQTWSRVGRRIFIFVEPKVRQVEGRTDFLAAFAVGSGQGR